MINSYLDIITLQDLQEYESKTDSDKIEYVYSKLKRSCWKVVNKYYQLDNDDKESIILESIYTVVIKYDVSKDNFNNLIYRTIKNNCINLIRRNEAKKRGEGIQEENINSPIVEPYLNVKDNSYSIVESKLLLEDIRPYLSSNEYEYLKLVIQEPHFDEMSNIEIANILNITEGGVRYIRKSLQNKKMLREMIM